MLPACIDHKEVDKPPLLSTSESGQAASVCVCYIAYQQALAGLLASKATEVGGSFPDMSQPVLEIVNELHCAVRFAAVL